MKIQNISVLLVSILLMSDSFAAHLFWNHRSGYEVITGDEKDPHIDRLLRVYRLNDNQKLDLATRCLKDPEACSERNIFQKISVNFIFPDGQSFAHKIFNLIQSSPLNSSLWLKLMNEALNDKSLNPHIKNSAHDQNDLALDVFKSSQQNIIKKLFTHENFNPNTCYGAENHSLATKLVLSMKYDNFLILLKHRFFDPDLSDTKHYRPGYYLLTQNMPGYRDLFIAFMGSDLEKWNMSNLGLSKPAHFDLLFKNILQNDKDRLIVFKLIITQLCLWHENIKCFSYSHMKKIIGSTFLDESDDYKIYININFTQGAVKILSQFGILKELTSENDARRIDYWSPESKRDFKKYNNYVISSSRMKHFVDNKIKKCELCLRSDTTLIKSSPWCGHGVCSNCWTDYCDAHKKNKEMLCPHPTCSILLAPSLFIALYAHQNDDSKSDAIINSYQANRKLQQKIAQKALEKIPGFIQCPKCHKNLVLNPDIEKSRVIKCTCSSKFLIHGHLAGGLLPFDMFQHLGECCECKNLVDKRGVSNNENIYCPLCKKNTKWLAIQDNSAT